MADFDPQVSCKAGPKKGRQGMGVRNRLNCRFHMFVGEQDDVASSLDNVNKMSSATSPERRRASIVDELPVLALADALLLLQCARRLNALLVRQLKPLHLRPETWEVLELVSSAPRPQAGIAPALGGLKGSVSRWIVSLHDQGLVRCESVMGDRRTQIVHITEHGRNTLALARQRLTSALSPLYQQMCSAERVVANRLCRNLLRYTDHGNGPR